jgi:hypothetical protein
MGRSTLNRCLAFVSTEALPRTSKASRGGFVDHVLNRGNGCSDVLNRDDDFAAFVNLMREAHEKVSMRLAGSWLLTKHFHLLLAVSDPQSLGLESSPPTGMQAKTKTGRMSPA